ncbi:MAG: hypothetical protein IJC74_07870 [Clostridia bacterium]|nr:hypothetical protein [Clostridia bacterium]
MCKKQKLLITAVLAVSFILCIIYCIALKTGIADNGSLASVESALGLSKTDSGGHFNYKFNKSAPGGGIGGSLSMLFAMFTALPGAVFDARCSAVFYIILMLVSFFLIIKNTKFEDPVQKIIGAVLFLFIFFDAAYLAYFNTLYPEAGFNVFLILTLALFTGAVFTEKYKIVYTVLFAFCAVFACGFKMNTAVMCIVFALMAAGLAFFDKDKIYRIVAGIMAVLILIVPLAAFKNINPAEYRVSLYHSVFYGIAKENPDAVAELGLPDEYKEFAGKTYYEVENVPEEFYENMNYKKVVLYYITHPGEYFKKIKVAANNGFEIRPRYIGSYPAESGKGADELSGGFVLYSFLKRRFIPANVFLVLLLPVLIIGVILNFKKLTGNKKYAVMIAGCALLSLVVFNIPYITGGEADLGRNMAIYSTVFDVMLYNFIIYMLNITTLRRREFKEKYGADQ